MTVMKKRGVLATLVVGGLLAFSSMVMAAPANAIVWGCTTGYSTVGAFATCSNADNRTTDKYSVAVLCQNWFTKQSRVVYGNQVTVNSTTPSTVQGCGAFESFYTQGGPPWVKNW